LNDGVMTKSGGGNKANKKPLERKSQVFETIDKTDWGVNEGSKSRYFDIDCWGEKHGLLQFPKASKRERNEGCEGLEDREFKLNRPPQSDLEAVPCINKNFHPTIKPVHLMSWLVRLVSKEGDVVLDPFMGSGTTGVACKLLNRDFIGIELSEEYYKIAEARIKAWKPDNQQSLLQ